MKVLVVFYSMYGHVYRMAEAVAEGAREVAGAEVSLRRVPETLPAPVLEKMGATAPQKTFAHVPACTVDELAAADAILFHCRRRLGTGPPSARSFAPHRNRKTELSELRMASHSRRKPSVADQRTGRSPRSPVPESVPGREAPYRLTAFIALSG